MKVLADTSAWIHFLRRTGSSLDTAMRCRLDSDEVATTDIVIMEVLAGTRDAVRLARARRALDNCTYLSQHNVADARAAAALYRICRRAGETPRQMTDCMIAAVARRNRVAVLHLDRDYDVLARHSDLQVVVT